METVEFIYNLTWEKIPAEVQSQARRCLLDTFGAAIAGRGTELSRIIHDFSATAFLGSGAKLWQDGRQVSPPGAALANAMTIDSFDIHDGHKLVKGHAGAAVVPAALATISLDKKGAVSGQEFLATLVMGYEIALRAGIALHATACDYHTSGAWNTLGAAAVTSRRLGLHAEQTRHALGIAEYHGPRSPMMRDIDFPTMVKDGSGWGAMAGVSAGMMAASGFTGAPALSAQFPAQRFARVQIETVDGKLYELGETTARWEPSHPPTDEELLEKFRWLAGDRLSEPATAEIERCLWNCASLPDIQALIKIL